MKHLPYLVPVALALGLATGLTIGRNSERSQFIAAKQLVDYAAGAPTTEEGGVGIRQHPVIGPITNILIEPGRLSVYGRNGSRIWYYPEVAK